MATNPLAIIDHKLHFLRAQIQSLTRPLSLPDSFDTRRPTDIDASYVLRRKLVDDALISVNNQIRKHAKLVYPVQATRHVAEQLDGLYWHAGEKDVEGRRGTTLGEIRVGTDLTQPSAIQTLPDVYPASPPAPASELQAQYQVRARRLQDLDERRTILKDQVATYRALKAALLPMQDAVNNVQPNLCTRGSEMEQELEKMRTLLARVVGRIAGLEKRTDVTEHWAQEMDENERIQNLLSQS